MDTTRITISNKSDKPDNIVKTEAEIFLACEEIEASFPPFLKGFFVYLKGNVLPRTRLAYLHDIKMFLTYLLEETSISQAKKIGDISQEEFKKIKASDINLFLDFCRRYAKERDTGERVIYENNNRSLARKKSSLSVLFKQLYRDEIMDKNITEAFDSIRVPRPGEKEIKALMDDEVMVMLDAVTTGEGLTDHEKLYWEKTKKRDKAILILFLTYGLRLSELCQLNLSSFQLKRGEFKIYRKRGKESLMPLNKSVTECLTDYVEKERRRDPAERAGEDPLFLSLQGKRMTQRQVRSLVKKYSSIALGTSRKNGYSPHKLRATAATSLIGRGNSIYDVAALLDHEQVTTTQLYARQRENVKRDLVKDMEWEEERKEGAPESRRDFQTEEAKK